MLAPKMADDLKSVDKICFAPLLYKCDIYYTCICIAFDGACVQLHEYHLQRKSCTLRTKYKNFKGGLITFASCIFSYDAILTCTAVKLMNKTLLKCNCNLMRL